jgi:hypothetical protein
VSPHAKTIARTIGLLALLASASGCAGFRAQFGGGIGIGADIKIPGFCHTGLSAGEYMNVGIRYDEPELSHDAEVVAIAWHWEGRQSRRRGEGRRFVGEHACFGWIPPVTTYLDKDDLAIWDLEIGLNLLVIDLRLGFNPVRLVRPPHPSPADQMVPAPPPPTPRQPAERDYYESDPLLQPGDPPPDRR